MLWNDYISVFNYIFNNIQFFHTIHDQVGRVDNFRDSVSYKSNYKSIVRLLLLKRQLRVWLKHYTWVITCVNIDMKHQSKIDNRLCSFYRTRKNTQLHC